MRSLCWFGWRGREEVSIIFQEVSLTQKCRRDAIPKHGRGTLEGQAVGWCEWGEWGVIPASRNVAAIRTRMDDITHESFVDALDEPLGGIFWASYSPPPEATTVDGVALPAVRQGCERAISLLNVGLLAPLSKTVGGVPTYRYTGYSKVSMSKSKAAALRTIPRMLMRRLMRSYWEGSVVEFDRSVRCHKELSDRMETSPQAELYIRLRQRLMRKRR